MRNRPSSRKSRGFTLVELMVGVLIGLIGTVVIFQVFAVSESQKRTTTGGSDAQQNGVFGLFQIERDVRMAGYGLNHMALLGCQINGWYEPGASPIQFKLVPVEIINGAAGAPDQIRLAFGNSDLFMAPAKIIQTMPNSSAVYKVNNRFGFKRRRPRRRGGGRAGPARSRRPREFPAPGNSDNVVHNSGNYTNPDGANVPARLQPARRAAGAQRHRLQRVEPGHGDRRAALQPGRGAHGGDLHGPEQPARGDQRAHARAWPTATAALADGVVQLQAQYGYDGNGDGRVASNAPSVVDVTLGANVDQWADNMPVAATGADWARVIAVRLVVTARSMTPERPNPATGRLRDDARTPRSGSPRRRPAGHRPRRLDRRPGELALLPVPDLRGDGAHPQHGVVPQTA